MSNENKHILVIRLSAMGDVAMSVPVIKAFVQQYPSIKLTILTRSFFKSFFKDIPNVSIYSPELKGRHKGFLGIQRLSKELSELHIDAVADLHNVLRSNLLIRFLKLKGIPFQQIDKGRSEKKALVKAKHKIFKPLLSTHNRYADVFDKLGYPIDLTNVALYNSELLSSEVKEYINFSNGQLIGIAPFAAHKGKMYPIEAMESVIKSLIGDTNIKILLFGGGKVEKKQLGLIADKYDNVFNIAGKFSFDEELALISNLDLMLSMDSGNGHIAAMYGVDVVTIWGVTHPYAGFVPFQQKDEHQILPDLKQYPLIPTSIYGNKYPENYLNCFNTITVDDIVNTVKKVLVNKK